MKKQCALVCNIHYVAASDKYIPTVNRNAMVHSLITACDININVVIPHKATFDQLRWFHSEEYLTFLMKNNEDCDDDSDENADFGFGYDCPLKPGIYDYCLEIAGGSITAASLLCEKKYKVVMHWLGGWHHAKTSEAAGYCYVNDCVLAILQLRRTFPKVLYIDLDLHHGDGVQDAFYGTDKVLTFSVHKYESGFFPGSGNMNEVGFGKGKYYAVNIPLLDGAQDDSFITACRKVLPTVIERFSPDAVVCQVGVDGLAGDPMRSFNLTPAAFQSCVKFVLDWGLPTLFLGGGGYNAANSARCWTLLTTTIAQANLPDDIPEHDFFPSYGPDFDFAIEKNFKKDMNSDDHIQMVVNNALSNLTKL